MELLNVVLVEVEKIKHGIFKDSILQYWVGSLEKEINIYELDHKCKEWAYDNDWFIYERKTPIGNNEYSALNRDGRISPSYNDLYVLCQWILDHE
jgi:hypothetical protein